MNAASKEIVAHEERFWQSMVDKDGKSAKALIADQCLITGPMGATKIDPGKFENMMRDGKWTLETFEFSDVEVIFPSGDIAVISYKVRQVGAMGDKPMDLQCADATTWVRDDSSWKCALHTETVMDKPK